MKSFFKKNKLALFLLASVLMLSVFYIVAPNNEDAAVSLDDIGGISVDAKFSEERLGILEERNLIIASFEEEIASGAISEVGVKLSYIEELDNLICLETKIEDELLELGYEDVLVYVVDSTVYLENVLKLTTNDVDVTVKVIDDELTVAQTIDIMKTVKTNFGGNQYKIKTYLVTD